MITCLHLRSLQHKGRNKEKELPSLNGRGEATRGQHCSAPRQRAGGYKTPFESQRRPLEPKPIASNERTKVREQQLPTVFPRHSSQQSHSCEQEDSQSLQGNRTLADASDEKNIADIKRCARSSQQMHRFSWQTL